MVSERNRILKLKEYIESFGIIVNISKNKAQGHKGFFKAQNGECRIDISKGLDEKNILTTLCHEFGHYIHYIRDNKLKSLEFIFGDSYDEIQDELLEITVDSISKKNIKPLFELKDKLKTDIDNLNYKLATKITDFKVNSGSIALENKIKRTQYKHLLKHDKVQVLGFFTKKLYTIDTITASKELSMNEIDYLQLKSKLRALKRVNARISKINRYYNSPTELFARTVELYVKDKQKLQKKAPQVYETLSKVISDNKIPELTRLVELVES